MRWTEFDLEIMALTVWAEARGEGPRAWRRWPG